MKRFGTGVFLLIVTLSANSQSQKEKKGYFYFAAGTHKAIYSKSDIHLKSASDPSFDFTLKKVRAKDDFFLKGTGGAPQYDYQMGYYFKKKDFGIEFNFDHIKYFVRKDQTVRTVGTIDGQKIDADLPVTTYVQNFEHSDGANYALINFIKLKNFYLNKKDNLLDLVLKAGAGPVIPKTNSRILDKHWDDKYHLAGYVVAAEAGLRYNFSKTFFVAPSIKGAFANYTNFLIAGGTGNQKWFSGQVILSAGVKIQ